MGDFNSATVIVLILLGLLLFFALGKTLKNTKKGQCHGGCCGCEKKKESQGDCRNKKNCDNNPCDSFYRK